jgi:hypothetical protein
MSGSTPSYALFRILIKQGTKSGSIQPSPGGNEQSLASIRAMATASVTVEFIIVAGGGERLIAGPTSLSSENTQMRVTHPAPIVNDYTLTANITEPAPTDVTIEGTVNYAPPPPLK